MFIKCFKNGNKLLLAGNGGSAAEAQHMAAEYMGRFLLERSSMPAIALTTDTSVLTSISNDYEYSEVFARQVEALGNKGDIFVGYSTSGKSSNILKALQRAKNNQVITVGFTGEDPNEMRYLCDYLVTVPSSDTARIQELHLVLGHMICGFIESQIYE